MGQVAVECLLLDSNLGFDAEAECCVIEFHGGYVGGGAGHADGVVVADLDADLTAGHVHGDAVVD